MLASRRGVLRWLVEIALVVAVLAVAVPTFGRAQAKQDGDEAMWMGTARFFLTLFVQHDISAEAWPDNFWTRTHPMMVRYVMGGWLWAHGYDLTSVDPHFDYTRKWFTNVEMGKAPSEAMLTEMRRAMRGLAVVCAVLMYGIVRVMAGRIGGLATALLFCGSPYITLHFIRAKGETILMVFLLAALFTSIVAMKRGGARGPSIGCGIATGVLLGLSIGSKLTALVVVPAILAWSAWVAVGGIDSVRLLFGGDWASRWMRRQPTVSAPAGDAAAASVATDAASSHLERGVSGWHGRSAAIWGIGVLAIAAFVFVAHNPYLYPDPIGRTWLMLTDRQREMSWQAEVDPSRAVTTVAQRMKLVWRWSLTEDTWGDYRLRWPIEAPLAAAGLVWLSFRVVRWNRGEDAWLLLWVACIFAGVTWGLGYLLDHYFVPTAAMGLLLNGLAIGWGASWLGERVQRFAVRRRGVGQVAPAEPLSSARPETITA